MNTLFEPPDGDWVFLSLCLPGRLKSSPVIELPVKTGNMITAQSQSLSQSQGHNTTIILLNIWHSFPSQFPVHSTTRVAGRLSLRYPMSSLLEPGQFVSSSSSSCRSWIRLERPLDVSWVQPGGNIKILKYVYINKCILSHRIRTNSIEKNIIEFQFVTNLRCIQNLS